MHTCKSFDLLDEMCKPERQATSFGKIIVDAATRREDTICNEAKNRGVGACDLAITASNYAICQGVPTSGYEMQSMFGLHPGAGYTVPFQPLGKTMCARSCGRH